MRRFHSMLWPLLLAFALNGCMTISGFSRAPESDLYVLTGKKPLIKGVVQVCRADGSCVEFARSDSMKGQRLYGIQALAGESGVLVQSGSFFDAGRVWLCTELGCDLLARIDGFAGLNGKLLGQRRGLSSLLQEEEDSRRVEDDATAREESVRAWMQKERAASEAAVERVQQAAAERELEEKVAREVNRVPAGETSVAAAIPKPAAATESSVGRVVPSPQPCDQDRGGAAAVMVGSKSPRLRLNLSCVDGRTRVSVVLETEAGKAPYKLSVMSLDGLTWRSVELLDLRKTGRWQGVFWLDQEIQTIGALTVKLKSKRASSKATEIELMR
jgi:hypothetical protein